MALTELQRAICRLLAENRIDSGESYVAGGAALNELLASPRVSRDVDLFHQEALVAAGAPVATPRGRPGFVGRTSAGSASA
jgi:hypothetical protein